MKIGCDEMDLRKETLDRISKTIEEALGLTYEEFSSLDFDQQQKILAQYRKKHKDKNPEELVNVMIGYGEHSSFIKVKKGETVMIRYGNMIEAGLTLEESKRRLEDKIDDIVYSKPVAFVKKLKRKIQNKP